MRLHASRGPGAAGRNLSRSWWAARWSSFLCTVILGVVALCPLTTKAETPPSAQTPPVGQAPPAAPPPPTAQPDLLADRSGISPLRDIGFDQKLGAKLPLDIELRDETGRVVRLGEYFGRRPVLLSLAYYDCPMLCGMALQGIASALRTLTLEAGKDFEVVTVSFDPRETPELARSRKATYLAAYGRPQSPEAWHFLTGDEAQIRRVTGAVGFRYVWDGEQKQFAHATGLVLLTPDGRIARYLFGVEYAPKDLRLGLVEASEGRIGTLADKLLLLCYQYDAHTGRYSAAALGSVRAGAILTVFGLGAFILIMARRERRQAVRPERRQSARS